MRLTSSRVWYCSIMVGVEEQQEARPLTQDGDHPHFQIPFFRTIIKQIPLEDRNNIPSRQRADVLVDLLKDLGSLALGFL